jgi:uncharacterized protein (TIGR00369 family)
MTAVANIPAPPARDASGDEWVAWANRLPQLTELNITCRRAGPDSAEFDIPAVPFGPNPNGSVNGGLLAAIADQAMGVVGAMRSVPGHFPVTGTLQVQYHRPAYAPLHMHASLMPSGRKILFVDVAILDSRNNLCASARGTMVLSGPAGAG